MPSFWSPPNNKAAGEDFTVSPPQLRTLSCNPGDLALKSYFTLLGTGAAAGSGGRHNI